MATDDNDNDDDDDDDDVFFRVPGCHDEVMVWQYVDSAPVFGLPERLRLPTPTKNPDFQIEF